jgi:hypothetical protein
MKFATLIFLFISLSVWGCEVTVPSQLLVFSHDVVGKKIYQSRECENEMIDDLHLIISNLEGRVAAFQLKEIMSAKGHDLQIFPQSIVVQQFKTIIREQLPLPAGVQVKDSRLVNMSGVLALNSGDSVEVNCHSCLYGMQQPLTIQIKEFDGTHKSFFATADFKKMVKAYRLLSALPSFSSLNDQALLKEELIESIPHTDLITDLETLKFFKTNKPLRAGDIIKRSDLNAINLVKAGLKTDVVLENQMIRIKTQGISRGNGAIGDIVEVFHPQKNKKYQGKVIDINKVLVEL